MKITEFKRSLIVVFASAAFLACFGEEAVKTEEADSKPRVENTSAAVQVSGADIKEAVAEVLEIKKRHDKKRNDLIRGNEICMQMAKDIGMAYKLVEVKTGELEDILLKDPKYLKLRKDFDSLNQIRIQEQRFSMQNAAKAIPGADSGITSSANVSTNSITRSEIAKRVIKARESAMLAREQVEARRREILKDDDNCSKKAKEIEESRKSLEDKKKQLEDELLKDEGYAVLSKELNDKVGRQLETKKVEVNSIGGAK